MYQNIIFDLGGVLIDFKSQHFLQLCGLKEAEQELFSKIIFGGEEWSLYSQGEITLEEVKKMLVKNYRKYADKINLIFEKMDFKDLLFVKEETAAYLVNLKKRGLHIYILSDLSKDNYEYNKNFDFYKYVDGGVYSFELKSLKPNLINYQTILKKYHLKPKETIFIDDRLANIDAANSLGIKGILFTNVEDLKKQVEKLID